MSALLSIITPVLNGRTFIEGCLRCVIDQNCPIAEHIIIDGGSTDGTTEVIDAYAKSHNHIRWRSQPGAGQSEALNYGIDLATGDIISSLNVDDYYSEGVLSLVTKTFESLPKPSFMVGNCIIYDNNGDIWGINRPRFSGICD